MKAKYGIGQTLAKKYEAPSNLPEIVLIKGAIEVKNAYNSNPLTDCTQNNGESIVIHSSHISYLSDNQDLCEEKILDNWYEIVE